MQSTSTSITDKGVANSAASVELRAARIPGLGLIAEHFWFVVAHDDRRDRWEVWQNPDAGGLSWQHLHRNLLPCDSGVGNGDSRMVHRWHGAVAKALIGLIEHSPSEYPHCQNYRYWPGPNSNTYVQWILNRLHIEPLLGPSAIGKDYLGLIGVRQCRDVFQLSTPLLGFKLHRPARFELHLLSLTFGVQLSPLRLLHPLARL